jgi:hypothetical protein
MHNEEQIRHEVEKTLAILDSVQHAKANPFFYTRLNVQIKSTEAQDATRANALHARILLGVLGIIILIALNVFSFFNITSRSNELQKAQTLASIAEEYHLTLSRY